jgi:neopullulanase
LDFFKKIGSWRRDKSVIHKGKLTHFVPQDNLYVYFRYNESESVMVVLNYDTKEAELKTARFAERMKGFGSAVNVLTGEKITDLSKLKIPARSPLILELK